MSDPYSYFSTSPYYSTAEPGMEYEDSHGYDEEKEQYDCSYEQQVHGDARLIDTEFSREEATAEQFRKAAERINAAHKNDWAGATKKPTEEEMLRLYGLYKQAYYGDCNISCPTVGWFDFSSRKAKKKWESWDDRRGMHSLDAMKRYVHLAKCFVQ